MRDDETAQHEEDFDAQVPLFAQPIQDGAKQSQLAVVRQHSVQMVASDRQDRDSAHRIEHREAW